MPVPEPALGLIALALVAVTPTSGDLYVDQAYSGCPTGTGTASAPYCAIGTAVAAALPGDTIHVAPGTYVENLTLAQDVTLIGTAGELVTIVDGAQAGSVVTVTAGTTADLRGLTLRNGLSTSRGGGLSTTNATTTLTNTTIAGNTANLGGGIFAYKGSLSLYCTTVSGNVATLSGGGIDAFRLGLAIHDSTISGNSAGSGNGGGLNANPNYGTVTISGSTISGNDALSGLGGGIGFLAYYNFLYVDDTTIEGNTALEGGGVCSFGVYDTVNISTSTIRGNTALTGNGGGVSFQPYYGVFSLESSTLEGNTSLAGDGGGAWIDDHDGPLVLRDSTISGNSAPLGMGGGLYLDTRYSAPLLTSLTVTGNTALLGGGVCQATSSARIGGSLVAVNSAATSPDVDGIFISNGFNLIGDVGSAIGLSHGVAGDQVGSALGLIDPLLAPLAANGGPTPTHALLAGSPAIDTGDPFGPSPTDQRGVLRPQGAVPDVGAFELGPTPSMVAFGAGSGGAIVPALAGVGTPTPGAAISLDTSSGLGGTLGLVVVGAELGAPIVYLGGAVFVTPQLMFAIQLGGTPGVAGAGVGSLPLTIPSDMSLVGLSLAAQAGYLDPSALLGVAMTNPVRITFG